MNALAAASALDLVEMRIRFERQTPRGGRFYSMRIERELQVGLFDDPKVQAWLLIVTRGSLDPKRPRATERQERFEKRGRAFERWGELCSRRRRRGYQEQEQDA